MIHSKLMLSGPGALVEGDECMAFRISSGLIGVHWRGCLLVLGGGSNSVDGGGWKRACLNSWAFSWKLVAVLLFSVMSGVCSVRWGLVYLKAVKMSLPWAFLRKSFQRLVLASFIVRWYRFRIAVNWFQLGVVLSDFHCLSRDFMRVRFLLISSFHQGLERGQGFVLGMLFSAASWINAVRNFAALLRLAWLLWW